MIKKIIKLLFILWQSRQGGHAYGKPWKYKTRKGYKHDRRWAQGGYAPYGHGYGDPGTTVRTG